MYMVCLKAHLVLSISLQMGDGEKQRRETRGDVHIVPKCANRSRGQWREEPMQYQKSNENRNEFVD